MANVVGEAYTENGAIGFSSTGNALVDFLYAVPNYREDCERSVKPFTSLFRQDIILATKTLFFLRDIRGGMGERATFRRLLCWIQENNPPVYEAIVRFVPEYGRWDDIISFPLSKTVVNMIKKQLKADKQAMLKNEPVSLLAKWLPSENTSSIETRRNARKLIEAIGYSAPRYRKLLSKLRAYLKVVERSMSNDEWDKIVYSGVPSKANMIYNDAFMRHDEERRTKFLKDVSDGKAKINASTLYPHDIVNHYFNKWQNVDNNLELAWKEMAKGIKCEKPVIVVRDGSGSMTGSIGNTNVTPLSVATALAILFSEKLPSVFKDKFITFSSRPELVDLSGCKTLLEKVTKCTHYDDCTNTNIEETMNLIFKTAVRAGYKTPEFPIVLIISDMEFDAAISQKNLFEEIRNTWHQSGYELPPIVFWNVGSRTNTIPMIENGQGVLLLSGYSTSIIDTIFAGKFDPLKALLGKINSSRYDKIGRFITLALNNGKEKSKYKAGGK